MRGVPGTVCTSSVIWYWVCFYKNYCMVIDEVSSVDSMLIFGSSCEPLYTDKANETHNLWFGVSHLG